VPLKISMALLFDAPSTYSEMKSWVGVPASVVGTPIVATAATATKRTKTPRHLEWLSERATDDLQRALLYLGVLVAAVAWLRERAVARLAEPALAAVALAAAVYGLAGHLLPHLVEQDLSRRALGRLEQPLTYWNAVGALAALGLVLCARMAGDVERRPASRPASADAFREQSFEMRERAEEPVVEKRARVVEEVKVGKKRSKAARTVEDTVRKTEVEVDRVGASRATYQGPERRLNTGTYSGQDRRQVA